MQLETERLVLRLPEAGDLAWQVHWLNTSSVMRHLGGIRAQSEVAASFDASCAAFAAGQPGFWTVVLRSSNEPLGKCGLSRIEELTAPDRLRSGWQVGWSLAEPFWGQGFASEAARAVITLAFTTMDLAELWSQTSDSNAASTRMMARLGLRRCTDLFYTDPGYPPADNPTAVYRLAREEWAAQCGS